MQSELVLASTSRYRAALLERLQIPFQSVAPDVNEAEVKDALGDPLEIAEQLAAAKAVSVAERFPDAIVIGSDQVATIDGRILDKPGGVEGAIEQLGFLSGRAHELITAVCVVRRIDGEVRTHVDRTRLTMRPLSRGEIARYVALDVPLDCAGSYKIESAGIALFERIATEDFTAITGLPLMAVVRILREFGGGN